MSDLIHCQTVVEQMLSDRWPRAEVEEYIEDCSLDQMEKAGLWMLAEAHQDQATQTAPCQRNARARQQLAQHNCLVHPQALYLRNASVRAQ